ncbi:hypothetical protein BEH94_06955 [Candidatus Altiarchaeales archaeon WOR_SM1_SCG]|nr:hypothetical protein BEH94_06955 [Candidatus Altiarchaeales archaeon WOR_SM1_SCG]
MPGKYVEQLLRESEEKYRSLFENMPNGIALCRIILDKNNKPADFEYIEVNDAFEKLTGLKKADTEGKKVTELIPGIKESEPDLLGICGKVALTGEGTKFEIYFEPLKMWLSISAYCPMKGYFAAIFDNITWRKRAEESLMESEEKFRNLAEQSPNMIFIFRRGIIVYANKRCEEITGFKKEYFYSPGFNFQSLTLPEQAKLITENFNRQLRGENVMPFEFAVTGKEGNRIDVILTPKVIKYGGEDSILGIITDVTELKRAEEELHESSLYARSLIEASIDPLITIGREGKIMDVNKATEQVTGVSREHLVGSDFSDYFTETEKARGVYEKVLSEGVVTDYSLSIRHTSGRTTDVRCNATVYKNNAGEVLGVFAAARDITRLKELQEQATQAAEVVAAERARAEEAEKSKAELEKRANELEEQRIATLTLLEEIQEAKQNLNKSYEELKSMDKFKDEFINISAHELKTPLTPIIGYIDLMLGDKKSKMDELEREQLEICFRNAVRLKNLVGDITDVSKLETKAMKFNMKPVKVEDIINGVTQDLMPDAEKKQINIAANIQLNLPLINADPERLTQALSNLVENAIKFTDKGGVTISAEKQKNEILVKVEDTGIGIAKKSRDKLFTKFFQADMSPSRRVQGTGLGLVICKEIIESHGGKVRVEIKGLGKGSVFSFTLPADEEI